MELTSTPISRVTNSSAKRIIPAPSPANTRAKISMVPSGWRQYFTRTRGGPATAGTSTALPHEVSRMRSSPMLSLAALLAAPLAAQATPSDPDVKVAGGGSLPAGWSYRLEDPTASIANAKFVAMGGGFHFSTGPAGV